MPPLPSFPRKQEKFVEECMKINWFGTKVLRMVKIHPWGSYSKQFHVSWVEKNFCSTLLRLFVVIYLIFHTSYHACNPKEL